MARKFILVVNNLSRFVQYVELDLSAYRGLMPIELISRNHFPLIGDLPYMITLGPIPPTGSPWNNHRRQKSNSLPGRPDPHPSP